MTSIGLSLLILCFIPVLWIATTGATSHKQHQDIVVCSNRLSLHHPEPHLHLLTHLIHNNCLSQIAISNCWRHHRSIKNLPKRVCARHPTSLTIILLSTGAVGPVGWWIHAAHVLPNAGSMLPDSTESTFTLQHLTTIHMIRADAADLQFAAIASHRTAAV